MWKCRKCGEECEDTFDSCWNCGTSGEGGPPGREFGEARQDADRLAVRRPAKVPAAKEKTGAGAGEQPAVRWKCRNCGEECEDTFDACWNCGAGREGDPPGREFGEARLEVDSLVAGHDIQMPAGKETLGGGGVQEAAARVSYKVETIDIGCCEKDINPKRIEHLANRMAEHGFRLQQVYVDTRADCCYRGKTAVLVFVKRGT
ncbi:MAG: hypothetical protein WB626_11840 [Bacteroidota bacterium]